MAETKTALLNLIERVQADQERMQELLEAMLKIQSDMNRRLEKLEERVWNCLPES